VPRLTLGRCQPAYCVRADSLGHLYDTALALHTLGSPRQLPVFDISQELQKELHYIHISFRQITCTYWRRISAGAVTHTIDIGPSHLGRPARTVFTIAETDFGTL
jgi:hypothetical protein